MFTVGDARLVNAFLTIPSCFTFRQPILQSFIIHPATVYILHYLFIDSMPFTFQLNPILHYYPWYLGETGN